MRCSASVRLLDFFLGMTGDSAINELVARWRSTECMSTNSLVFWREILPCETFGIERLYRLPLTNGCF